MADPRRTKGRYVQRRFTSSHSAAEQRLLMACVTTRSRERILCLSRFVHIERDITAQMRKKKFECGRDPEGGAQQNISKTEFRLCEGSQGGFSSFPRFFVTFAQAHPNGTEQSQQSEYSPYPRERWFADKHCFTTRRFCSSVREQVGA